jgi:hypothetical protein
MAYNDDVPSGQGLDGLPGFFIRKSGFPHSTQFLNFSSPTIFRIQPEINAHGQEMPWRLGTGQGEFSGWIKGARIATKMGVNGRFTCLANVFGRPARELGPIDVFASSIQKAVERNPRAFPEEWSEWVKYNPKSGQKIIVPEYFALVQGLLFSHGGKTFLDKQGRPEPKHPTILCLKTSARFKLQDLCNVERPGFDGNPEDYNKRFPIGDCFSLNGGKLIKFLPVPDDGMTRSHYDIELLNTVVPLPMTVAKEWTPWDQLLQLLTEEEQVQLLVAHFPPEVVDFALGKGQYARYLPEGIRGSFDRSRAIPVPAQPYGAGGYTNMNPQQMPVGAGFQPAPAPVNQPWQQSMPVAAPAANQSWQPVSNPSFAPAPQPRQPVAAQPSSSGINFGGDSPNQARAPEFSNPAAQSAGVNLGGFGGPATTPAPAAPQPPRRADVPLPPQVVPMPMQAPVVFTHSAGAPAGQPVGDPNRANYEATLARLRGVRTELERATPPEQPIDPDGQIPF